MMSIVLMKLAHKQFDNMTRELMRQKVDIVSHTRHHVYTRTKKGRKVIKARREKRVDWKRFVYFI
jgi:predicted transcriptional regulator